MKARFPLLLLVILPFSLPAAPDGQLGEAPPNFIIFVADDMGWNDNGPYGNAGIRTPSMDRLAREGLTFNRALLTTSSCSPSRASILTGRYPHNTGAPELHMPVPADQVLLSSLLREAGYYTASAGKWHLGDEVRDQFDRILQGGGPSGCEKWVEALRDRPRDKPFFLWLAAFDPHRDYAEDTIPEPHSPEDVFVPPFLPDAPEVRADLARYYDEITRFDSHVGQVLEELERQGVAGNTLVLLISDNGRPFPRCKTRLLDSGIRTPLIARWPGGGIPRGRRSDALVSSIDIAPTILELAGMADQPDFQGSSFARTLKDPQIPAREFAFAEHNWHDYMAFERAASNRRFTYIRNWRPDLPATPPADAVRSPTYQLMLDLERRRELTPDQCDTFMLPRPGEELYDNVADPYSLHNLAEDPRYAGELKVLRGVLDDWTEETGDLLPGMLTKDRFDRTTGEALP